MEKLGKKLISILIVLILLVTSVLSTNTVFAEGEEDEDLLTWEVVENDTERTAKKLNKVDTKTEPEAVLKGKVRVSIVLDGKSTMDAGYSTQGISLDPSAVSYRESLKETQDDLAAEISGKILNGEELNVIWNLTLAANIISAEVPAEKIDEIKALDGVKDVVVEMQYYPQVDETVADDPNMSISTGMTGTNYAWAAGYTGAGSKVAIVDTGLDIEHISYNSEAFDYAISELEELTGKQVDLFEEKDVKRFWSMLNASDRADGDGSDAYLNSKIPFMFNYIDSDYDVTHMNDGQGEHGSHVAGIAAANKYIVSDDGEMLDALDTVLTQGNAPDAQVFVMKVFGKGGGAYDSDYFAAIEDAIVLGADTINLSLGSASAGMTYNPTYKEIIDGMTNVNMIWANSAGNNYYWGDQTYFGYLYSDASNLASGGSPATYASTMSVASVDNDGVTGPTLNFYGYDIFYNETSYGNKPMTSIAGDYEFIYIDSYGTDEEFEAVADVLEGKIAICNRGSTSFYQKANAAAANGAAAVIIANNTSGTINMNLTGYEYTVPVVSITYYDGLVLKYYSEKVTTDDGAEYYTGPLSVGDYITSEVYDSDFYTMSDFSSWGVPGDLSIKPEITTPGGDIYSLNGMTSSTGGHDQYELLSGTSMASPQLAGIGAVMAQYVKENDLDAQADRLGITRRALIQSMLMSTARPLFEYGGNYINYYSVMKQGAGLADVEAAINSNIVILMDSTAVNGEARKDISAYAKDGKVKAELGDDPDRTGRYTVEFTLNNITGTDLSYDLSGDFFTQDVGQYFEDYGFEEEFMNLLVADLHPTLTWYVNDARFEKDVEYDFDGNPDVFDDNDAKAILNAVVAGDTSELPDEADLNGDGDITTYDAYLALRMANEAAAIVPAYGTTNIRVEISFDEEELEAYDRDGAYIEGYLYAQERDSLDGEIGVLHSIPVLGFYGSWSEPSMLDVGSLLEYDYGLEERIPYMYAPNEDAVFTTEAGQTFIYYDVATNANYTLGGNPLESYLYEVLNTEDNEYVPVYRPERNAINSSNTIVGAQYTLIRNAAGIRFDLTDSNGEVIDDSVAELSGKYASYYNRNQSVWQNTKTSSVYGYNPGSLKEGSKFTLRFLAAPEYFYDDEYNIRWDEIIPAKELPLVIDNSAPVFESIFAIKNVTETEPAEGEEAGEEETVVEDAISIMLSAYDNEYLAGLFIYDEDDNLWFAQGPRDEKTGVYDIQEYILSYDSTMPDHLYAEAWDYAGNVTTVQINLNKAELDEPVEVTLDEEYVATVVGNPYKLTATVSPWGFKNQSVEWTSSDESIAVVNEYGVVTGVAEGSAIITATSVADPSKSASCYFDFIKVEKDLNGIIWDENGEVWFSSFNTATIPEYEHLSPSMRMELTSTAYGGDGTFYVATFDSEEWTSVLYKADEDTFELTEVGPSSIGYMDLAPAPSLGDNILLGVYGPYIVLVDATSGDYMGVFDSSSYANGNYLVGIAYEEQYNHPSYGDTDWVWVIDQEGNLYEAGFLPYGGSYSWFGMGEVGQIADGVDIPYWQSLYYDGESVFWSRFNYDDNKVDLYIVNDIYNDGSVYKLGSFADSVWPVSGLYGDEEKELIGIESSSDRHAGAVIDDSVVFETQVAPIRFNSVSGKLNSVAEGNVSEHLFNRNDVKVDIDPANEDHDQVIVLVKSDGTVIDSEGRVVSHNGLFEIEYDTQILELADVISTVRYYAVNDSEEGKVSFGFIDLYGVETGNTIAKVVFNRLVDEEVEIKVNELEKDNASGSSEPIDYDIQDSDYYDWGDILLEDRPASVEEIPDGLWLSELSDMTYDGTALKPEFRVYDFKTMLTEGKDYTVKFKNNKKAASADGKKAPTVTVTGKGNYKDSISKTFTINPAEISNENTVITLNQNALAYTGKKLKPVVTKVEYNGKTLLHNGSNITITYENPNSKEEGTYKITVTGKGNYTGTAEIEYVISKDLVSVNKLKISSLSALVYTGYELKQEIVVKDGKTVLSEGTDYSIAYKNNVDVGKAYVTITGLGKYVGSVTKGFKIKPVKLTADNVTVTGLPETVVYCGEFKPETTLTLGNKVLEEGTDYTVTFKNNNKVGTATVTFKGIGNYSGSFKKTFKITAIDLNGLDVAEIADQPYQKGGTTPDVTIFDRNNNVKLVKGTDYTLTYQNNKAQGEASVTIKGKGNYTGSIVKSFKITEANIANVTVNVADKAYSNKKDAYKSKVTLVDSNGKKLKAGTDYEKSIEYVYADSGEAVGTDIPNANTIIKVVITGKGNYSGTVSAEYRIVTASIAKASVKILKQFYTGKAIEVPKEDITIKVNKVKLEDGDYQIVSYTNNVNKGTATVVLKGVGNYGGTKTVKFKIVQKTFWNAIWR